MSRSRSYASIEVLESRIAPALLINGANLLGGSGPATGESSVGGNSLTVVKMLSGQAIVWYQDGDILGISVGPNVSMEIHGDVLGDIVANLLPNGRLSDSNNDPLDGEDGAVLLPNNILGIKTFPVTPETGSIQNIITAGSVANLNIQGSTSGIYAGDGVFGSTSHKFDGTDVTSSLIKDTANGPVTLDFNPVEPGVQSDFVFTKTAAQTVNAAAKLTGILPGASISNVNVAKGEELQIFAGSGNPNEVVNAKTVAGGSIKTITIQSAFTDSSGLAANAAPSYELKAGDGSSGLIGGAGGSIAGVIEKTSTSKVVATAGNGGTGSTGAGGAGGSITNYDAGSNSSRYTLTAGNGGNGIPGGVGGSVIGNNFANRSTIGGIVVSGDFYDNPADPSSSADDIVVINQGTGEMVIERNLDGTGSTFVPIIQHGTGANATTVITGFGDTPISAFASDVNHDGTVDIVVAYKNSNSLGVFFNEGNGIFWDASLDAGAGAYAGFTVGLSFSPSAITHSGDNIIAAENTAAGTSSLYLLKQALDTSNVLTYSAEIGFNTLSKPVADLVTVGDGSVFVGTVDGALRRATISGSDEGKPFDISLSPLQTLSGGLIDLDVDSTGEFIVAIGAANHSFTVYDYNGATSAGTLSLLSTTSGLAGKPLAAHFVASGVAGTPDQVAILESLTTGSRVDLFSQQSVSGAAGYTLSKTVASTEALKNFTPVYSLNNDAGFAAISGSLSQYTFSDGFVGSVDYALPFASKLVEAHAGNGGDGIDFHPLTGAVKSGHGGNGGSIINFNAEANDILMTAGNGGNSVTNGSGNGGSISNPPPAPSTTTSTPAAKLILHADESLSITAGTGGTPTALGTKTSTGGAGGSVSYLNTELSTGDQLLTSGNGGDSYGGAAGAAGNIVGITSLLHDGNLVVMAGHGGEAHLGLVPVGGVATSGAGGAGGSVIGISHVLTLDAATDALENPYSVTIMAGYGGASVTAAGGAGGSATGITLKLDGANVTYDSADGTITNSHKDSTLTTFIKAGTGGGGAIGGNGGLIQALKFDLVLDQIGPDGALVGPAVLGLQAGDGGTGSNGAGGNGGSIILSSPISGLRFLDQDATVAGPTNGLPLYVKAGDGQNGTTKGGNGGDISGLTAQNEVLADGSNFAENQLTGAYLAAGHGGNGGLSDGGRGGNITNTLIGVQNPSPIYGNATHVQPTNFLRVLAGYGGDGGVSGNTTTAKLAKGGAGGSVTGGELGLVSTNQNIGMDIIAGYGGSGYAVGGAGGTVSSLKLNSSQSTSAVSAILTAGDGGISKLATGIGGKGGNVSGISQVKDVNSSINLIQAGNGGGNALGKGGAGGAVSTINTVGFIGRPSDGNTPLGVLDTVSVGVTIAQGVFSGRGGVGSTALLSGINGSVTGVTARQIAAIAAAMDVNGLFAAASKVSGITADLIGFDKDRDAHYDNANGSNSAPDVIAPIDGFIFSQTKLVSVTGQRAGFVFAPLV